MSRQNNSHKYAWLPIVRRRVNFWKVGPSMKKVVQEGGLGAAFEKAPKNVLNFTKITKYKKTLGTVNPAMSNEDTLLSDF